MKEHQTPHKVFARSAENRNGRFPSKKSNKAQFSFRVPFLLSHQITNKSLNAAFTSVSEDSEDLSPISHANRNEDVTTFWLEDPSVVTMLPSEITPKTVTTSTDTKGISSTNCIGACELNSPKSSSVEAEITVNFLRNVKPEVLNSVNAASHYRKLMDELIEYVIHDLNSYTLPEETGRFAKVLSVKKRMLFICTFVWVILVSFVLFFTSDVHSHYSGPRPT
ncbi:hypothetical protein RJT34_14582 [Clitoria ternatea]|uniref:Uncharacterized protein n=1 Tax=Clitoria ternatea TaxID=43366 RepID=A0AAN9JU75_CLITE